MPVPTGYTTLFPYLIVRDAIAYIDFLVAGLGATEIDRQMRPDGKIANSQVRFDDTTIMVSEATAEYPPGQVNLYLYTEDADSAVQRAVAHGGTLHAAVEDKPYGDRQGGVSDPAGNIWWISKHLSAGGYD